MPVGRFSWHPLFCGLGKQGFQGFKWLTGQVMARNQVIRRIKCEINFTVFGFPGDRFERQINGQRGILIHQWRPGTRVTKNEEFGGSH